MLNTSSVANLGGPLYLHMVDLPLHDAVRMSSGLWRGYPYLCPQ